VKNSSVGKLLLVLALWLGCSAAGAQSQAGDFVADAKSGCKVWNPHPQSNETVSWSRGCVDGLAQGSGSLQWLNNNKPYEKDEGEWNKGQQSGRGKQVWSSGRYDGDILNGEPHGQGAMTLLSARYEGEFRNGKPNGPGTVTNLEGVFKGNWKDGCLVGDKRRIAFGVPSSTCR
jgi:MORN repeat protein